MPVAAIGPETHSFLQSIAIDRGIMLQLLVRLQGVWMQAQSLFPAVWIALACACSTLGQTGDSKPLHEAAEALRRGNAELADQIATKHLEAQSTPDRNALWIRANAREALEDYLAAALDFESLAQLEPAEPRIR